MIGVLNGDCAMKKKICLIALLLCTVCHAKQTVTQMQVATPSILVPSHGEAKALDCCFFVVGFSETEPTVRVTGSDGTDAKRYVVGNGIVYYDPSSGLYIAYICLNTNENDGDYFDLEVTDKSGTTSVPIRVHGPCGCCDKGGGFPGGPSAGPSTDEPPLAVSVTISD